MVSIPGSSASRDVLQGVALADHARALGAGVREGLDGSHRELLRAAFGAGLDDAALADAYAQTVCYALFCARCRDAGAGAFDWRGALRSLPGLPEALARVFEHAAWTPAKSPAGDALTALAATLAALSPRGESGARYGFEHFFAAHSPREKRARGVFYTPAPVASYVVRAAEAVLRDDLGITDGFSDRAGRVRVIDPAAGTGTFLLECVERVREHSGERAVRRLRGRLFGYELLPAACAAAQVSLGISLGDSRAVHCRDALDPEGAPYVPAPGDVPVIVGNPPWSGHSAHTGPWIAALLRGRDERDERVASYFHVDGEPLGEKNPKWLNDDYVKFLRLAQWHVERAGTGVVAVVCNHGFVDHPTFRGVRAGLMQAFDVIRLLDLHGNAKRGERDPESGGVDQNVFDVQTGVCVLLMARTGRGNSQVFRADLWGSRERKYDWLAQHDVASTPWEELSPRAPSRLFVREESPARREEYERWPRLPDAMPVYSPGIVTGRDALVFDEDLEKLRARVLPLGVDGTFVRCLYRPFDRRWLYDSDALVERPRREVMAALASGENLALIARRQMLPGKPCSYFGVADCPASDGVIRSDNHGSESVFPMYTRDGSANFSNAFIEGLCVRTGLAWVTQRRGDGESAFGPGDVVGYAYAWFFTPAYRERYAEQLRRDFPRIPWPRDATQFRAMSALGRELVALHTRGADAPGGVVFRGDTGRRLERVRFDATAQRVEVGDGAWFEGVSKEAWEFRFGGYEPCRKWLSDRKWEVLSEGRVRDYVRMVASVSATVRVMASLDAAAGLG